MCSSILHSVRLLQLWYLQILNYNCSTTLIHVKPYQTTLLNHIKTLWKTQHFWSFTTCQVPSMAMTTMNSTSWAPAYPVPLLGFRGLPVYHCWISWDFDIFQWNILGYRYIYIYHMFYTMDFHICPWYFYDISMGLLYIYI